MDKPVMILQISDLHILAKSGETMEGIDTEYSFCKVLEYAHAKHGKADLILVTGDIAQTPCHFSYQRIVQELEKYETKTVCLPGNHDDFTLMQQIITGAEINCQKYIAYKHWQIICLNSKKEGSEGGYLASDELAYLSETLEKHPDLNTLLAVHHHPVPTNSLWMDTMIIENSDELFLLLQNHPQVKAITCGHIHQKLEVQKEGKLILGMPSSCFQFKPKNKEYAIDNKKPGYRTLKLFPNGLIESKIYRVPLGVNRY